MCVGESSSPTGTAVPPNEQPCCTPPPPPPNTIRRIAAAAVCFSQFTLHSTHQHPAHPPMNTWFKGEYLFKGEYTCSKVVVWSHTLRKKLSRSYLSTPRDTWHATAAVHGSSYVWCPPSGWSPEALASVHEDFLAGKTAQLSSLTCCCCCCCCCCSFYFWSCLPLLLLLAAATACQEYCLWIAAAVLLFTLPLPPPLLLRCLLLLQPQISWVCSPRSRAPCVFCGSSVYVFRFIFLLCRASPLPCPLQHEG